MNRLMASAYTKWHGIKSALNRYERGSEFVQFAAIIGVVVLGAIWALDGVREAIIDVFSDLADNITNVGGGDASGPQ